MTTILFILVALLVFGVLIAVHELGHFLAAKFCGVQVNEFSIGMGPAVWKRDTAETQYSLRLLPIGGYHEGENGLMIGDRFYSIDGYRTYMAGDASLYLTYNDGQGIDLVVLRNGEKVVLKDFPMYRAEYVGNDGQTYRGFGIYMGRGMEEATFGVRLKYVWYTALDFVQMVRFSLTQMITGNAGMDDIGGPVAIVGTITQAGTQAETPRAAADSILFIAALIAINLSVMNLLPIPALDGGHILFLLLDTVALKLFKKKIPEKFEMAVTSVFLVLLLIFMAVVAVNDVRKLFG